MRVFSKRMPTAGPPSRLINLLSHPSLAKDLPCDALEGFATRKVIVLQLIDLRDFHPASVEDVCRVHNPRFVEALQGFIKQQHKGVVEGAPTYVTSQTFEDSLRVATDANAGSSLQTE